MKRDSSRLEPVIDDAVNAIKSILKRGEHDVDEFTQARIATSTLATWAKLKQSERAADGLALSVAQQIAGDPDELAQYVKLTMPDTPIAQAIKPKQLGDGKK